MTLEELRPDQQEIRGDVTISSHKQKGWVLELKASMRSGARLRFEYTADGELTFNIHSHHGKEVTHHVHIDAATGRGEFIAPEDFDFYPMWENLLDRPVHLTYLVRRE